MRDWHNPSCRKPDITIVEGLDVPSCQACGEMAIVREEDALDDQPFDLPQWEHQSDMNLWWPPSVEYLESSTNTYRTSWDIAEARRQKQDNGSAVAGAATPSAKPTYGDLKGRQIRVLELSPGRAQDPIHIELQTVDLFQKPDYEAVSYTWANLKGDSRRSKTVYVGQRWHILRITENCDSMLRRVRFESFPRPLWVDAICINQGSPSERSHQVGIMRDIYATASSVLIFLEGNEKKVADLPQRARPGDKTQSYWQAPSEFSELVRALCSRPYFSRIWIIQEIAAARQAQVVFGPHICRWEQFHAVARHLPAVPWLKHFDRPRFRDNDKLCDLLMDTAGNQAGDPRDRVFALLGLISGPAVDGLEPDYNLDLRHVLVGITAYHLTKHPTFAWRIFSAASTRRRTGLPSWVPDWSGKGDLVLDDLQKTTPTITHPGFGRSCSIDRRTGSLLLTVRHVMTLPRAGSSADTSPDRPASGPANESFDGGEPADADHEDVLYFVPSFDFYVVLRKARGDETHTLLRPCRYREEEAARYQGAAESFAEASDATPQGSLFGIVRKLLDAAEAVGHEYSLTGKENPWATLSWAWQAVRNTAAADADLRRRLLFRKAVLLHSTCTSGKKDCACSRCPQLLSLDVERQLLVHFDNVLSWARALRKLTSYPWQTWMTDDQRRELLAAERPFRGTAAEAEQHLPLHHAVLVSLLQDPDAPPFGGWGGGVTAREKTGFVRRAETLLTRVAAREAASLAREARDVMSACHDREKALAPLLRVRAGHWREVEGGVLLPGVSPRDIEIDAARRCPPELLGGATQDVWIR